MDLAPGAMVTSNVKLLQPLGQGGMGSVWVAMHLGLEAQVAVKFIDPDLVKQDPTLKERFKREASIAARLRSIHAVQTFDHGVTETGTPYIVMELLEGTDLTNQILVHGPMSLPDVAVIVDQIAKVLHRAHVLGVVHRDIKPDNIFLTDSEYDIFVKVLDFGIAKQTRIGEKKKAVTKTGAVIGTPEFMSPEQAIGAKDIDHRSDLFSLAVVAYYALTAELPFDPNLKEPLWYQMTQGMIVPVRTRRPDLPHNIEKWFDKALAPKPEKRFQSAKKLTANLHQLAHGQAMVMLEPVSPSSGNFPIDDEESYPAMYDLYGPESTDFVYGNYTALMNAEDHVRADRASGTDSAAPSQDEDPPTLSKPPVEGEPPVRLPPPRPAAGKPPSPQPRVGRTTTLSSASDAGPASANASIPDAAWNPDAAAPAIASSPALSPPSAPSLSSTSKPARDLEPLVDIHSEQRLAEESRHYSSPKKKLRLIVSIAAVVGILLAVALLLAGKLP